MSNFLRMVLLIVVCSNGSAKELTVMFGDSRPPFISQDPPSGISYELFKLISSRLQWRFQAQFAPNKRMEYELSNMKVDAIVEVQKDNNNAFYSDPFIAYRNFAVSRSRDKINFLDFSDLKGWSVCAWQNATKNLGAAFEKQVPTFSAYKEFPFQEDQVRHWLSKQCEAIIIDDTVLKWWVNVLNPAFQQRKRGMDEGLVFVPLPNHKLWWYVAFSDESLRDSFNLELQKIRSNQEYEKIREQVVIEGLY
ncbi:MAG: polar amino acid transport system substrate-binding protein [Oleiphilaceae bacterium]